MHGFRLFAELAHLPEHLERADLVITGEGALDQQTLMGKGVGELALMSRDMGKPCVAIAGTLGPGIAPSGLFRSVHSLTSLTSSEEARANAAHWLAEAARRAASEVEALKR